MAQLQWRDWTDNSRICFISSVGSAISWRGLTATSQLWTMGTITSYHRNVRKWYHSGEILEWLFEAFQNTSVSRIQLNWLQLTHLLLNVWLLLLWKGAVWALTGQETLSSHLTLQIQAEEITMQTMFVIVACRIHSGHLFHSIFWTEFNANYSFHGRQTVFTACMVTFI